MRPSWLARNSPVTANHQWSAAVLFRSTHFFRFKSGYYFGRRLWAIAKLARDGGPSVLLHPINDFFELRDTRQEQLFVLFVCRIFVGALEVGQRLFVELCAQKAEWLGESV